MTKVRLYESIRKTRAREGLGVRALARKFKIHRRTVREALASALPAPRKITQREAPALGPFKGIIAEWLLADATAPSKQRHTGNRIWQRLVDEHGCTAAASTVRREVARLDLLVLDELGYLPLAPKPPSCFSKSSRSAASGRPPSSRRTCPLASGPASSLTSACAGHSWSGCPTGPSSWRPAASPSASKRPAGRPRPRRRRWLWLKPPKDRQNWPHLAGRQATQRPRARNQQETRLGWGQIKGSRWGQTRLSNSEVAVSNKEVYRGN